MDRDLYVPVYIAVLEATEECSQYRCGNARVRLGLDSGPNPKRMLVRLGRRADDHTSRASCSCNYGRTTVLTHYSSYTGDAVLEGLRYCTLR